MTTTTRYVIDPTTHNQVREDAPPGCGWGRLVWDGEREGLSLDEGIKGAAIVCRLLNLGAVELPTVPERTEEERA